MPGAVTASCTLINRDIQACEALGRKGCPVVWKRNRLKFHQRTRHFAEECSLINCWQKSTRNSLKKPRVTSDRENWRLKLQLNETKPRKSTQKYRQHFSPQTLSKVTKGQKTNTWNLRILVWFFQNASAGRERFTEEAAGAWGAWQLKRLAFHLSVDRSATSHKGQDTGLHRMPLSLSSLT